MFLAPKAFQKGSLERSLEDSQLPSRKVVLVVSRNLSLLQKNSFVALDGITSFHGLEMTSSNA